MSAARRAATRGIGLALALLAVAWGLAACGGGGKEPIVVSAAASLTDAFSAYGERFEPEPRFSFGGSDDLAAQIRQGARPDAYAAASTGLPARLAREGLASEPVPFAGNELVLAVPAGESPIGGLGDLPGADLDLVVGSPSVPVGSYTRELLGRLDPARADAILDQVRSREPDVKGVVAKLVQGAADAGFVYASDVAAAGDRLRAIELPRRLRPEVTYAIAILEEASHPAAAREFVEGLLSPAGQRVLRDWGFGPPPGRPRGP